MPLPDAPYGLKCIVPAAVTALVNIAQSAFQDCVAKSSTVAFRILSMLGIPPRRFLVIIPVSIVLIVLNACQEFNHHHRVVRVGPVNLLNCLLSIPVFTAIRNSIVAIGAAAASSKLCSPAIPFLKVLLKSNRVRIWVFCHELQNGIMMRETFTYENCVTRKTAQKVNNKQ
ncbi:hypothetical protein NA57DRAFT_54595 [Rhizodiscina lignyota]|uniref:Uncharacterized protein n=1 Tax=Rhizodiscina lignyota TaxID=1504668 RepID=A0A9P4MAM9_9PEZI|nr:hypothetical protein NA57DRAFT_54595 [Rhizodiscina lignyota]